jgi:hypothetical protein
MKADVFHRLIALGKKHARLRVKGLKPRSLLGRLNGPRVLLNSLPKAGTNLVERAISQFPSLHSAGWRTLRSWENLDPRTAASLCSLRRGGVLVGHLPAHQELCSLLAAQDIKTIFMTRNPKDMVVSYVKYVCQIDKTHLAHDHFTSLPNDAERYMAAILGVKGVVSPLAETMEKFSAWFECKGILVIRFENLIGSQGGGCDREAASVITTMAEFLNSQHLEAIKESCGQLLHVFGYPMNSATR